MTIRGVTILACCGLLAQACGGSPNPPQSVAPQPIAAQSGATPSERASPGPEFAECSFGAEEIQLTVMVGPSEVVAGDSAGFEETFESPERYVEWLSFRRQMEPNRVRISLFIRDDSAETVSNLEAAREAALASDYSEVELCSSVVVRPYEDELEQDPQGSTDSAYGRGAGGFTGSLPVVRAAQHRVDGALSREVVRRVIRRRYEDLRACYEIELESDPRFAARITLGFEVSGDGSVGAGTVDGLTGRHRLSSCLAAAPGRWRFPQPEDGQLVRVQVDVFLTLGVGP